MLEQVAAADVNLYELGYETVTLGMDELDENLLKEIAGYKGNTVVATIFVMKYATSEYVAYMLEDPKSGKTFALGVTKNGCLLSSEVKLS